jgi:hypothetical protein
VIPIYEQYLSVPAEGSIFFLRCHIDDAISLVAGHVVVLVLHLALAYLIWKNSTMVSSLFKLVGLALLSTALWYTVGLVLSLISFAGCVDGNEGLDGRMFDLTFNVTNLYRVGFSWLDVVLIFISLFAISLLPLMPKVGWGTNTLWVVGLAIIYAAYLFGGGGATDALRRDNTWIIAWGVIGAAVATAVKLSQIVMSTHLRADHNKPTPRNNRILILSWMIVGAASGIIGLLSGAARGEAVAYPEKEYAHHDDVPSMLLVLGAGLIVGVIASVLILRFGPQVWRRQSTAAL